MGNSPGDESGNSLKAVFRVLPLSDLTAKKSLPMIRPFSRVFILIVCFASVALADDFKTIDGKEYKNVKVRRVEPDGIVLSSKSGISKVYFTELPKEVQERFHYGPENATAQAKEQRAQANVSATANPPLQPSSTAAIDSQGPADLMSHAESALRRGQFAQSAELLNRIVSEHPASQQAQTVYDLRSFLRDKELTQSGPLTASEAQRLRSTMDALDNIRRGYRTATPEKRRALEAIFGAEMFQNTDNGLGSLSSSAAKLRDARDRAR